MPTSTRPAKKRAQAEPPSRQTWVEAYVRKLLKSGDDVNQTDKNGVTPLHHAVRFRSPAAVRVLLEHGARVNQACTRSGSTPLHRAVTSTGAPGTAGKDKESLEIVCILLEFGANPRIKNKLGKQPADYVRNPAMLKRLRVAKGRRLTKPEKN